MVHWKQGDEDVDNGEERVSHMDAIKDLTEDLKLI
ncbi:mCG60240 [Mus musculus]|nr:mCG60240 [Mus musculus]